MDLREFILALVADWVSLMSGIASVILALLGTIRKWQDVPRWAFITAAAICFFVASARIWTTEHRKYLVEVERNKPDFSFTAGLVFSFYSTENDVTIVLATVRIVNSGADSAVIDWNAHWKSPNLDTNANCIQILSEPFKIQLPNGQPFVMNRSEQIMNRTSVPIPRGGKATGWLPISVPGSVAPNGLSDDTVITVTITDYTGKSYTQVLHGKRRNDIIRGVPMPS